MHIRKRLPAENVQRAVNIIFCFCYFSSIGSLTAQTISVCGYIEPLFAVLLAAVVLEESLQPIQILGAVLIIVGALFGELWGIRQQKVMSESNPLV